MSPLLSHVVHLICTHLLAVSLRESDANLRGQALGLELQQGSEAFLASRELAFISCF